MAASPRWSTGFRRQSPRDLLCCRRKRLDGLAVCLGMRGKRAPGPRALHAGLGAPGASQMPGCCKHQSGSRAVRGCGAGCGQLEPREWSSYTTCGNTKVSISPGRQSRLSPTAGSETRCWSSRRRDICRAMSMVSADPRVPSGAEVCIARGRACDCRAPMVGQPRTTAGVSRANRLKSQMALG
jgi:hypothetical protein